MLGVATKARPLPVKMLATMIQSGYGGVGRYVMELAPRLDRMPELDLETLLLEKESDLLDVSKRRSAPAWDKGAFVDLLATQSLVRPPQEGIIFSPSYRRVPLAWAHRTVVTVHDLAPLHMPEKYGIPRYQFLKRFVPQTLRRAAKLIAVTEHTKRDLVEQLGLEPSSIEVIWNGIDHQTMHPGDPAASLERVQRWNPEIASDFVLLLARIEHPGKGHVPLLEAWSILQRRRRDLPQLVFAGAAVERSKEVFDRAAQLGVEPLVTGFVPGELVPDLYRSTRIMVFPSLYEGFGLPPVEALACGAPVASSRRAALSETAGPASELDPEDPEQMADAIERLLDDETLRTTMRREGFAWTRQFDWSLAAKKTAKVLLSARR